MNKAEALAAIEALTLDDFVRMGCVDPVIMARKTEVSCHDRFKWHDTVDGNPRAAYTEAHPYTGSVTISGRIGINGKKSGTGTYGV